MGVKGKEGVWAGINSFWHPSSLVSTIHPDQNTQYTKIYNTPSSPKTHTTLKYTIHIQISNKRCIAPKYTIYCIYTLNKYTIHAHWNRQYERLTTSPSRKWWWWCLNKALADLWRCAMWWKIPLRELRLIGKLDFLNSCSLTKNSTNYFFSSFYFFRIWDKSKFRWWLYSILSYQISPICLLTRLCILSAFLSILSEPPEPFSKFWEIRQIDLDNLEKHIYLNPLPASLQFISSNISIGSLPGADSIRLLINLPKLQKSDKEQNPDSFQPIICIFRKESDLVFLVQIFTAFNLTMSTGLVFNFDKLSSVSNFLRSNDTNTPVNFPPTNVDNFLCFSLPKLI